MSTKAPRFMAYAARSLLAPCNRPKPPAHQLLLAFTSAPAASKRSSISGLRTLTIAGDSNGPMGSLILALSSGWRSRICRTTSALSLLNAKFNSSTGSFACIGSILKDDAHVGGKRRGSFRCDQGRSFQPDLPQSRQGCQRSKSRVRDLSTVLENKTFEVWQSAE